MIELLSYYKANREPTTKRQGRATFQTGPLLCSSRHMQAQERVARRAEVLKRAKAIDEERLDTTAENLVYWERYREMKVELVKDYVIRLKLRKRIIEYAALLTNQIAVNNLNVGLSILQRQRRRGLHSLSAAIKFYCKYRMKHVRPYGATLEFRLKN